MLTTRRFAALPFALALALWGCGTDNGLGPIDPPEPGATTFVTAEPGEDDPGSHYGGADAGMAASADAAVAPSDDAGAPSGRDAEVQEAEIYRVHDDKLFFLNTYRGLLIYDIKDEANPKLLSRLGVYGVPIEMYFEGTTAFVLIKDALYLTQSSGAPVSFQRHNVSQLLTVDFSNPAAPKIVARFDIEGLLREGLSRKVDNTLYVVSEKPSWYYSSGWYGNDNYGNEEAYVHSYDVSDPKHVVEIDRLQLLSGGGENDGKWENGWDSRSFIGVAISATSNALMIAERWQVWNSSGSTGWCSESYNETRVSVVDISDPSGRINVHTRFSRRGDLSDQFKQTYIYEQDKQRGVYVGIFARREWTEDCAVLLQNSITAIDITDGQTPKALSTLPFGKPNEEVRGSLFDLKRKVAYAITVLVQIARDPLYAIDISNLDELKVLSEIDGLSGDINVFRPIGDNNDFLLTVGRDATDDCAGFEDDSWAPTRVAVSIFDARELNAVRLVQRRCVAVDKARWSSSAVNWDRDQAHKMLGMYSDAAVNLVAVPVSYYEETREGENDWWWYSRRSAVGMLSWDLSRYDASLPPEKQQVLQNLATVVHPNGEVKRTIFIPRPGPNGTTRRVMLTLSETHMAFNDVTDLSRPLLQSSVEVAPYSAGVYRVGQHIVEQVDVGRSEWGYWYSSFYERQPTVFKVKRPAADGSLGPDTEVARFTLAGVQRVMPHGERALLVLRSLADYGRELLVVDLKDPARPRYAGRLKLDDQHGWWSYYGSDAEGIASGAFDTGYVNMVHTQNGLALLQHDGSWDGEEYVQQAYLSAVDLSDIDNPTLAVNRLAIDGWGEVLDLVADHSAADSFYLNVRKKVGTADAAGISWNLYRHDAVPYRLSAGKVTAGKKVNLPGRLVRAFMEGDRRVIVARDNRYQRIPEADYEWCASCNFRPLPRLHLLTQAEGGGQALLRDSVDTEMEHRVAGAGITNDRLYLHLASSWYDTSGEHYERLLPYTISSQGFRLGAPVSFDGGFTLLHVGDKRPMLALYGDGVLTLDGRDVDAVRGLRFSRTLGWTHNAALLPPHGYVASGYFGTQHIKLDVLPAGEQL